MENFRAWLQSAIDELDKLESHPDPHEAVWKRAGEIAAEAGDRAARLGLAELHQASIETFGLFADPVQVKTFLSTCLGSTTQPKSAPALLSVEEVAAILDVSPSHVYRLADGGRMPQSVKIGNLVRWPRAEIEQWIANRCKPVRR